MKKFTFLVLFLFFSFFSYSQKGVSDRFVNYRKLAASGDSLYMVKNYFDAAVSYSGALRSFTGNEKRFLGGTVLYNAACAWALANYSDSAFYYLDILTRDFRYANTEEIKSDADFRSLQADSQWTAILKKLQDNARIKARNGERIQFDNK